MATSKPSAVKEELEAAGQKISVKREADVSDGEDTVDDHSEEPCETRARSFAVPMTIREASMTIIVTNNVSVPSADPHS